MAVTVTLDAEHVDVAFSGRDRLWALSRGIRVPLARLRGARAIARADAKRECPPLRLPGSYWPGRLHAGSYGLGERRQLWCVHRAERVLVLDLAGRPYSRVVVEVPDPDGLAAGVDAAAGHDAPRP